MVNKPLIRPYFWGGGGYVGGVGWLAIYFGSFGVVLKEPTKEPTKQLKIIGNLSISTDPLSFTKWS